MADHTPIEWTDATWNIVTGCSVVSPGCTNCYAMKLAGTRLRDHPSRQGLTIDSKAGPVWNGLVRFNADWLQQPLRWTKPRKIFVAAHGDLFHEGVSDDWLDQIFAVMALCPQHVFQVLTKRPERMRDYWADPVARRRTMNALETVLPLPLYNGNGQKQRALADQNRTRELWEVARFRLAGCYLPNVWLGVSIEDQARADERIPVLLDTPSAVRWISAEPLLGPVDLTTIQVHGGDAEIYPLKGTKDCIDAEGAAHPDVPALDWVVAGGESGPGARPMHPEWARSLRDQCAAAGTPFLFKQWGDWSPRDAWAPGRAIQRAILHDGSPVPDDVAPQDVGGWRFERVGKKAAGRRLDGAQHDGYPEARA